METMEAVGLVVPVLSNFRGFAELMASVDVPVVTHIIPNWRENKSVAESWNEGLDELGGMRVVIVVNDDVVFYPGTMEKLALAALDADLVSAVASDTGQEGLHTDGFPDYCCYAVKPGDFVRKFGWFDENFKQAYFEDNDMHHRIRVSGGLTGMLLDGRIEHAGSSTQFPDPTDKEVRVVSHQRFELNRDYYVAKWGGRPGEETYTTPYNRGGRLSDWDK